MRQEMKMVGVKFSFIAIVRKLKGIIWRLMFMNQFK